MVSRVSYNVYVCMDRDVFSWLVCCMADLPGDQLDNMEEEVHLEFIVLLEQHQYL